MPDVEKVINKVTVIVADMQEEVDEWKDYSDSELRGGLTCDCDWWYKTLQTLKDALALLKAQEAVKPIRDINGVYYCGNCDTICVGYEVEFTNSIIKVENYCHKCGRKVKWDG